MNAPTTMSVTEFKKHCLSVLSEIADHKIDGLVITKHGKPIARIESVVEDTVPSLYGCMKGSVAIPDGLDLSEVDVDVEFEAEQGILYK